MYTDVPPIKTTTGFLDRLQAVAEEATDRQHEEAAAEAEVEAEVPWETDPVVMAKIIAVDALDEFTQACQAVADFEEQHSLIIVTLEALRDAKARAEEGLKAAARVYDQPLSNEQFSVLIVHKSARTIDGDGLLELAPWLRTIPGAVTIRTTVSEPVLKGLVKAGSISQEVVDGVTTVLPMTTAITIRKKP